ncbi:reverse transcriptase domain-containing protein [Tanacetum coccineum]
MEDSTRYAKEGNKINIEELLEKHAPIASNPAPIQPNDYLADDEEEEPISEQTPVAPVGFAPQWIGWQDPNNNNGWLDEDDDKEPEEDEADEDNNEELEEEGVGDGEEEEMESDDKIDNFEVIDPNEAEKGKLPPFEAATIGTGILVSLTGHRLFTKTQVHMGSSSSATTGYNLKDLTPSHIRSDLNALHHRVRQIDLIVRHGTTAISGSGKLNFGPEDEVSPPRHQKERRGKDNRRPPVFGRIGKKVSDTQTTNLQNLDTHENNDWRISVCDRLGSRDVHSMLGQRRSPSESPPSSDSEDSRRKRRRRVSSSSEDSSDNEDAETGHWKSKNKYRDDEDEDMSRPWRRQKVDAFTRRISDFSEDKKRRMPANVKTYDGTGDPDDHLKIFESAATIENWPQPVWCHMFNSTLVGNARNWFSKLPRRSIDGFEELRRAFRLNFTQRKKCAKNPVELARVKQRQGESTSAYVERYKDECIHVKACPEILKISGFMNGINNPTLMGFVPLIR